MSVLAVPESCSLRILSVSQVHGEFGGGRFWDEGDECLRGFNDRFSVHRGVSGQV